MSSAQRIHKHQTDVIVSAVSTQIYSQRLQILISTRHVPPQLKVSKMFKDYADVCWFLWLREDLNYFHTHLMFGLFCPNLINIQSLGG